MKLIDDGKTVGLLAMPRCISKVAVRSTTLEEDVICGVWSKAHLVVMILDNCMSVWKSISVGYFDLTSEVYPKMGSGCNVAFPEMTVKVYSRVMFTAR